MEQDFGLSDTVINDLRAVFRRFTQIRAVWLFGSRAKGGYGSGSDIDLAYEVGPGFTFQDRLDLISAVLGLGLLYKVDLVDYGRAKGTPFGEHIDRVKKPLYLRDENK